MNEEGVWRSPPHTCIPRAHARLTELQRDADTQKKGLEEHQFASSSPYSVLLRLLKGVKRLKVLNLGG